MLKRSSMALVLACSFYSPMCAPTLGGSKPSVCINEIVVDPQTDRTGDGRVTGSDEFFELFNASPTEAYSLEGWTLELIDATSATNTLEKVMLAPQKFYVIRNPKGEQNNKGEIRLRDKERNLVDAVTYGTWNNGSGLLNAIPGGNSSALVNESLSRFPDGSRTWIKTYASPGKANISTEIQKPFIQEYTLNGDYILTLNVWNPNQKTIVLQHSLDLKTWNPMITDSSLEKNIDFSVGIAGAERGFYRVVEQKD